MKGFDTFLFVHIPKTAGTSLRISVEQVVGRRRVVYDYGAASKDTDEIVRRHYYVKKDLEALRAALMVRGAVLLGGHLPFRRYRSILPPSKVVTFLRNPVERVVSEYHHHRRHNAYAGSLLDFARTPAQQNLQDKLLEHTSLEQLGFFGLTETYAQDLPRLREALALELPQLRLNTNPGRRVADAPYEISSAERAEIRDLNQRDIALYERARRLLQR